MTFSIKDIKEVQQARSDLSDEQADDLLGFLCDVYSDKPYFTGNERLFKAAAELMYGGRNEH